jgi:hypothetical protein
MTTQNMTTISEMGPMIAEGLAKAQCSKAKPASRASAVQSKQSEGQSDTKGGQQLALFRGPSRGPDILKL